MSLAKKCAAIASFAILSSSAWMAHAADLTSPYIKDGFAFDINRKGNQIGSHKIAFTKEGDDLIVTIDINITVKFGPITVYDYEHQNIETWRDNLLVGIETRTDANGKKYQVSGKATPDGFEVSGEDGIIFLRPDIMPTSYWNPEILNRNEVLDTQHGVLREVTISESSQETGGESCGTEYAVTGELELNLWYQQDRLCSLSFQNGGTTISYSDLMSKS